MIRAGAALVLWTRLAHGDASLPAADELRTRAPLPPPRVERAPTTESSTPRRPAEPATSRTGPTWRESRGALDFVDATVETDDLSGRFQSTRPVVRLAPPKRKGKP